MQKKTETYTILASLLSDEFIKSVGVVSSARGIRRHLYKSQYVSDIKMAVDGGVITEDNIREFINHLMSDFAKGYRFPHELALAALSVVLETRKTPFAEEYLLDLARLDITEMTYSPSVARESMKLWSALPRYKSRSNRYSSARFRRTQTQPLSKRIPDVFVRSGANLSKVIRFREKSNAGA